MGPRFTVVDFQLPFLDRDIFLGRPDLGPLGQRACQASHPDRDAGVRTAKCRRLRTAAQRRDRRRSPEIAQAQVRVAQIRLRLNQLGLFVGQGHLGAARVQRTHEAGAQPFALAFQFLPQDRNRFLPHVDFFPVQEQFVKSEPHVHRYAIGHGLEILLLFLEKEARDLDLIASRTAIVKIFSDPERDVIVLRAQLRRNGALALAIKSGGNDRGKITGARFKLAPAGSLNFLPGNCDLRILALRQPNDIADRIAGSSAHRSDRNQGDARQGREAKNRSHELFLHGASRLRNKIPSGPAPAEFFRGRLGTPEITSAQPIPLLAAGPSTRSLRVLRAGESADRLPSGDLTISGFIVCVLAPDERMLQCWRFT